MNAPRTFRTEAIIMKRRDLGEADRILTLLTPDHGKIDVVAKGARKPSSRKTGHVELFMRSDVLIAKGRSLDVLVQADMLESYLPIREDLIRGAYANYVVELLDRFTYEGDEHHVSGFYILLHETLYRLAYDADVRRVVRYYEFKLLNAVGYRPELLECVIMHEPLMPKDQFFSFTEGGVVSPEGAPHTSGLIRLPVSTLKVMRHMQRSKYKQVARLTIPDDVHDDLERVVLGYIRFILENKLQSVDFIRRVRNLPAI